MIKNILENKKLVYAAYGAFFIYLAIFVFWLQKDAYWTVGDDFNFIETTARGIFRFAPSESGERFYPWQNIENNLLLPFGRSFIPYLLLKVALLGGYLYFMYKIFRIYTNSLLIPGMLILILSTKDMYDIYSTAFYQEPIILLMFTVFIYNIIINISDYKVYRYGIALACAVMCTYQKEVYFSLFAAYGVFMLIFQTPRRKKEVIFYVLLLINALVFLLLYYYRAYLNNPPSNSSISWVGMFNLFFKYLQNNPLFLFFILLSIVRGFFLIFQKDRRFLLADIFLFMGIMLILVYTRLGFYLPYSNRYILPTYPLIFISAVMYFSFYKEKFFTPMQTSPKKWALAAVCCLLLASHISMGVIGSINSINNWLKERRYAKTEVIFFSKLLDRGYTIKMNSRTNFFFDRGIRSLVSLMYTGGNKYLKNLDAFGTFNNPSTEEISGKTIFLEVPYWVREQNSFTNEEHLHNLGLQRIPNLPNINRDFFIINPIYSLYSSPSNVVEIEQTGKETLQSLGLLVGEQ